MIKNYNIALTPSNEIAKSAEEVSGFVKKKSDTLFTLNETTAIPHITLLHIAFEESVLPQVKEKMKRLTENFSPFRLRQVGYRLVAGVWIDMSYEHDEPLMKLHDAILNTIAPLRVHGPEGDQKEEWSDMSSPARQENVELYGSAEVRSFYMPHLTLTKLTSPENEDILEILPDKDLSFSATALALYELGEYGTCKNMLVAYPFGDTSQTA